MRRTTLVRGQHKKEAVMFALGSTPLTAIDVPGLLQSLDRYPYGCTEQTVSRALPLLYVNNLAAR